MFDFSAEIAKLSASGDLEVIQISQFSAIIVDFSAAGNSKIGELEAVRNMAARRLLAIILEFLILQSGVK